MVSVLSFRVDPHTKKTGPIIRRMVSVLSFRVDPHTKKTGPVIRRMVRIKFSSVKVQLKTELAKFIANKTKKIEKNIRLFMIFIIISPIFTSFPRFTQQPTIAFYNPKTWGNVQKHYHIPFRLNVSNSTSIPNSTGIGVELELFRK